MSHQKPLPATKDGYRYHWGEDDEVLCGRYIKDLNSLEANKKVIQPSFIKRRIIPPAVRLSENDRAPQLKLEDDCTVTGEKGYSMVRATHGTNRGKFYYEVHVVRMPEKTAARIGWSQYFSNLQAPLGYDYYGYSWRSRYGTKFHQARGKTFDKEGGYAAGDTIGCMIELPYGNPENRIEARHLPVSIKSSGYIIRAKKGITTILEEKDQPPTLTQLKPLVGSKISFYKNGKLIGVAFQDIFAGSYYPTISLYKNCTVTANFGPNFKFPPEQHNNGDNNHINYKPISDLVHISIIDNFMADLLYIVEQENSGTVNKLEDMIRNGVQGQ